MAVDADLVGHVLPKNFLRPCLLLLLHDSRRTATSFASACGHWVSTAMIPDRRTYQLTRAGDDRLRQAAAELQSMHAILDALLLRCDESSAREGRQRSSRRTR